MFEVKVETASNNARHQRATAVEYDIVLSRLINNYLFLLSILFFFVNVKVMNKNSSITKFANFSFPHRQTLQSVHAFLSSLKRRVQHDLSVLPPLIAAVEKHADDIEPGRKIENC